jgi:predicted O-linked N-acetylglucosamine transferase (SPINDLY family)
MLLYCPGTKPREITAAHVVHAKCLANEIAFAPRAHAKPTDPDKKLHVAFVSPDLYAHSVSYFLESVLDHADREQMTFTLYMTGTATDATSVRLAEKARFLHTKSARAEHLAGQVVAENVDVLFDLAGITKGGNLGTFHLRPAPVQVTYIGYPATSGVPAMGYRIVDSLTDPPGSEEHCTEKLVRLDPCFLCYRPNADALKLEPRPSASPSERPFTFGSFNSPMKLNDELLRVWARLLHEVPGSKLMLKFGLFRAGDDQKLWDERFARAGIPLDRLITPDATLGHTDHLMKYHEVDLGLDTFPYHGTTTTCEAMLMGVPVVTRAGDQHVSRVGVSLLTNVGHPELIARDEDDYVRIAKDLATNPDKLHAIRGPALREKFLKGPICDGPAFGRRFTKAVRTMWREACGLDKI